MKRAAVAPYSNNTIIFKPFSTSINAQKIPLLWYIRPKSAPPVLRAAPQRRGCMKALLPVAFHMLKLYFEIVFYRRYRRFTWAKPLRKASHVHGWGYDRDAAENQTIALVQGSLQLLISLNPSTPLTHIHTNTKRTPLILPLVISLCKDVHDWRQEKKYTGFLIC